MKTVRLSLFALLSGIGVLAGLYAIVQTSSHAADLSVASSAECSLPSQQSSQQTNPNKHLFISCGGFLD